jgi:CHAD domain-containing protein
MNASVLSIRLLSLLEKMPSSKQDVHLFRTTIRRLEVHLANPPAKIAKPLKRLRKKAGTVRDIDVHLSLLKPLLSPPAAANRALILAEQRKLREILKARHDRQLDSLQDAVADARPMLEKKLPALAGSVASIAPTARDLRRRIGRARRRFLQLTRRVPKGARQLHQLRIQTKKLRYSIEPLPTGEAVELTAKFKLVQDAIGAWHDWATLAELARRTLSADAEPLCAALEARTGREHNKARRAVQNVRSWMNRRRPASTAPEPQPTIHAIHQVIPKAG